MDRWVGGEKEKRDKYVGKKVKVKFSEVSTTP
jgi:hypothetical protein